MSQYRGVNEEATISTSQQVLQPRDTSLALFWSPLLRSASTETGLPKDDVSQITETITDTLDERFMGKFDADLEDLLALDTNQLEDSIASETRALRRDVRRTRKKQELLADEKDRLQAFRPARKATEQDEVSEIASKLHPLAKQFLSRKAGARDSMSSRTLQELSSAQRELESREEGLNAYDPDKDVFFNDLLKRLKPSKSKKQQK